MHWRASCPPVGAVLEDVAQRRLAAPQRHQRRPLVERRAGIARLQRAPAASSSAGRRSSAFATGAPGRRPRRVEDAPLALGPGPEVDARRLAGSAWCSAAPRPSARPRGRPRRGGRSESAAGSCRRRVRRRPGSSPFLSGHRRMPGAEARPAARTCAWAASIRRADGRARRRAALAASSRRRRPGAEAGQPAQASSRRASSRARARRCRGRARRGSPPAPHRAASSSAPGSARASRRPSSACGTRHR